VTPPSIEWLLAEVERARASEHRLRAVLDAVPMAAIGLDREGTVTLWNAAAETMFGWRPGEVIGKPLSTVPDPLSDEVWRLSRVAIGNRASSAVRTRRRGAGGRPVDVALSVAPLLDPTGAVVGAIGLLADVGGPTAASQGVAEHPQGEMAWAHMAAIVDSSDDAIVSKTLDGVVVSWNRAAERMFGWTSAEAVGRHIGLIIPEERLAEEHDVLSRIRRGEMVDHFETVRITKDGRLLDISLTVSPIRDATGRIVGASKIARDITERRRLEEERKLLLARAQQARAEAEAVNRAKDIFLATVSHELRTPLNAVFGWARLLQTTEMDEAGRARAVAAIVRGASAQAQLIEDLLDLSRIVTGRMRLNFEPVDLSSVVEAALDTVRPAADGKGIELIATLDPHAGPIAGAPDRLQQVVWNLLMNSVKFTPRGGRVDVSVTRDDQNAQITVADTGEGIAAEVLPYVFDRFRQEDSSSTRAHAGLGLGLALVRHLVELHGGSVRADSPGKGRGATFTVTLPLAGPGSRALARAESGAPGAGHARLSGVRVLVVDDDPEALRLSSAMLRSAGADVKTAASAFRAYEVLTAWAPDVLVSDLAMPREDGFMLLGALRGELARRGRRLPAIALTAHEDAHNRRRALEAGFDRYMVKPVDPTELAAAVAEVARPSG
jgi:PAS domain S-box-containing protein